jgi:hypothetical protein
VGLCKASGHRPAISATLTVVGRGRRIFAGLVGAIVLVLVLAQVFLPRIAASVISSRMGRYGKVQSVSVKAWPAVELLWGKAESVQVKAKSITVSSAQATKLLWEARGMANMDLSAEVMRIGALRIGNASLSKHGSALAIAATTTNADIEAALPGGVGVHLLRSEGGEVEVQATGSLFGTSASVDAVADASEGKLVAHPRGFLLEGLSLTLLSDPHIYVEGVGASVQSQQPLSYRLTLSARLL